MAEWKWWVGILVLAGAIVAHAAHSRYSIAFEGTAYVYRVDHLTGRVEMATSSRSGRFQTVQRR